MKKHLYLSFLLVTGLLVGACSEKEPAGNSYVGFIKKNIAVKPVASEIEIVVNWSGTTWDISLGDGSIVKSVSPQSGGDNDAKTQFENIKIVCNANQSMDSRTQTIYINNHRDGSSDALVLEQEAAIQTVELKMDPSVKYQPVVGFGGMYNPVIWCGGNLISSQELEKMYSDNGLGYSILRLMIYPNESDWQADVAAAKAAQSHGAVIFACPWDCTDALADMVKLNGKDVKHLKKENYAAYADHIVNYINYMSSQGVRIDAVSVQNEPDMEFTYWTPQEIVDFIKGYGERIRSTGVQLMGPETCGTSPEYTDPVINDADAFAQTDIIAGHLYQGFTDHTSGYVKNRHDYICGLYPRLQGKTWWMTEHLFNDGEKSDNPSDWQFRSWEYVLNHLALEIHMCMEANCSAYVYWYLKRFYGMMGDNDKLSPVPQGEIAKNGYVLSHYAKYASGTRRIKTTFNSEVGVTAYLDEQSGDISAVFLNTGTEPQWVEIPMQGIKEAEAVETTESKSMYPVDVAFTEDGKSIYFKVSGQSVCSVKIGFYE